jgi:hypothetical protein
VEVVNSELNNEPIYHTILSMLAVTAVLKEIDNAIGAQ